MPKVLSHWNLATSLAFIGLGLLIWSSGYAQAAGDRHMVTISAGEEGGVYYPAAGIICRLLNHERERHGLRCAVDRSRGSLENIENLTLGRSDIGLVQTDVQFAAISGAERYADEALAADQLRSLVSLHAEPITIVARLDAKVTHFRDLAGKRVNVGEVGSGTFSTASVLMQAYGMSSSDLRRQLNWSASEAGTALCENRIDAMILVVGHPNTTVQRVSESCAVKFVSVEGSVADALLTQNPYFSKAIIGANTYVGQEQDVLSLGVRASVMTTAALPEATAYEITRAVILNYQRMQALHPAFGLLEPKQMVEGNTAPWHPGALRFLSEQGLLVKQSN